MAFSESGTVVRHLWIVGDLNNAAALAKVLASDSSLHIWEHQWNPGRVMDRLEHQLASVVMVPADEERALNCLIWIIGEYGRRLTRINNRLIFASKSNERPNATALQQAGFGLFFLWDRPDPELPLWRAGVGG